MAVEAQRSAYSEGKVHSYGGRASRKWHHHTVRACRILNETENAGMRNEQRAKTSQIKEYSLATMKQVKNNIDPRTNEKPKTILIPDRGETITRNH